VVDIHASLLRNSDYVKQLSFDQLELLAIILIVLSQFSLLIQQPEDGRLMTKNLSVLFKARFVRQQDQLGIEDLTQVGLSEVSEVDVACHAVDDDGDLADAVVNEENLLGEL